MILVDENISHRLISRLADVLSLTHVKTVGMLKTPDKRIWEFAAMNRYEAILTADIDFQIKALEFGPPPKVIRIEHYDFRTAELEMLLRRDCLRILEFLNSASPLLVLRR